jgi:hypothetical protein
MTKQDSLYVVDLSTDRTDLSFTFVDRGEANQFTEHVNDLYGIATTMTIPDTIIDTYDSAIEALVEAIGPSQESE